MSKTGNIAVHGDRGGRSGIAAMGRLILLAMPALWLAACANPSWLDPTEVFGGPTPAPEVIVPPDVAARRPYPDLATVPDTRPRPSPEQQRKKLTKGLVADRGKASYTGEVPTVESVPPAEPPRQAAVPRPRPGPVLSMTPVVPAPEPPPPPATVAQPAAAATAPDLPREAPPPGEPVPIVDPGGRVNLAKGTPRPALAGPGQLVGVVYFAAGSTALPPEARQVLRDVALLQRQRGGVLRVVGHADRGGASTDPVGGRMERLERSLGRAQNVALAMIDLGVGRRALALTAASDTDPVYDGTSAVGQAGNRRVEIFLAE